jgi:hypothetical protein
MTRRGAPNILSQEHLQKEHKTSFHYPSNGQPSARDRHGTFILVTRNNLSHILTLPYELTSLFAHTCFGPTSTNTTLWHHHPRHHHRLGRESVTLVLRSKNDTGAKYDGHNYVFFYKLCVLAKLHDAVVNPYHGSRPSTCFHALNFDTLIWGLAEPNTCLV